MKKKISKFLIVLALIFGGGVVGFAASINFWSERDGANFEINRLFENGNAWKNKANEIQNSLSQSKNTQKELEGQIAKLRTDLNNTVSREEFNNKQKEVDEKQKALEAEQNKSAQLQDQLNKLQASNDDKDAAMQGVHELAKNKADELSAPQ